MSAVEELLEYIEERFPGGVSPALSTKAAAAREERESERVVEVEPRTDAWSKGRMSHCVTTVSFPGGTCSMQAHERRELFGTDEVGSFAIRRLPEQVVVRPTAYPLADRWAYHCPGCREYTVSVSQHPLACDHCNREWADPVPSPSMLAQQIAETYDKSEQPTALRCVWTAEVRKKAGVAGVSGALINCSRCGSSAWKGTKECHRCKAIFTCNKPMGPQTLMVEPDEDEDRLTGIIGELSHRMVSMSTDRCGGCNELAQPHHTEFVVKPIMAARAADKATTDDDLGCRFADADSPHWCFPKRRWVSPKGTCQTCEHKQPLGEDDLECRYADGKWLNCSAETPEFRRCKSRPGTTRLVARNICQTCEAKQPLVEEDGGDTE